MHKRDNSVTVLGAGSYGTALAITLARNGSQVILWGHNQSAMRIMAEERVNTRYLPDIRLPDNLLIEADLASALALSRNVLVVVPSHAFAALLRQMRPLLQADSRMIWATKGLEPETGRLLSTVAREILGTDIPLAVISGPTFAKEMAAGLPTAISLAATDSAFAEAMQLKLHCEKRFRVYSNPDLIGVQLGGAVKNVIAIGAGISDGIGFGANARTALITRGMAELTRLGMALGADPATFMGMAGLGDMVLTCTDNQSRNRRFGMALGRGENTEQALAEIGQIVEGYRNTKEVLALAATVAVEMPITEQLYQVLYREKPALEAALALLGRERKGESAEF